MKQENIYKIIGKNIKMFRKKEGLTLLDLSKKTGISPSFLSNIESGIKQPTLLTLQKVANVLKISITSLFIKRESNILSSDDDAGIMLNIIKIISRKSTKDKKRILNILKYL
ncbi:MAG: helix-turn-helix domain-containing protein [Candidatus Goldbacteria bacterium]|nr:helix-turn-helix domain-containing protein [Candidatus Goldiibacteriota bacterium]